MHVLTCRPVLCPPAKTSPIDYLMEYRTRLWPNRTCRIFYSRLSNLRDDKNSDRYGTDEFSVSVIFSGRQYALTVNNYNEGKQWNDWTVSQINHRFNSFPLLHSVTGKGRPVFISVRPWFSNERELVGFETGRSLRLSVEHTPRSQLSLNFCRRRSAVAVQLPITPNLNRTEPRHEVLNFDILTLLTWPCRTPPVRTVPYGQMGPQTSDRIPNYSNSIIIINNTVNLVCVRIRLSGI